MLRLVATRYPSSCSGESEHLSCMAGYDVKGFAAVPGRRRRWNLQLSRHRGSASSRKQTRQNKQKLASQPNPAVGYCTSRHGFPPAVTTPLRRPASSSTPWELGALTEAWMPLVSKVMCHIVTVPPPSSQATSKCQYAPVVGQSFRLENGKAR